jgi:hypothetical protein
MVYTPVGADWHSRAFSQLFDISQQQLHLPGAGTAGLKNLPSHSFAPVDGCGIAFTTMP